jgi:hypothetical protein
MMTPRCFLADEGPGDGSASCARSLSEQHARKMARLMRAAARAVPFPRLHRRDRNQPG